MAGHFGLTVKHHTATNLTCNTLVMNEKENHMNVILKTKSTGVCSRNTPWIEALNQILSVDS